MARAVGSLIGNRYQVVRPLGAGSFGEVYEALDHHQGARVAVKLLGGLPGGAGWAEAQILTHLRSDYILPVWNADFDSGVPFIVTELAPYGAADGRMAPVGVPPHLAVRWVRAACRGAMRTIDAGLLHRDIKPENLFLIAEDEAVLGDFGLAVLMNANGQGPWGGTPQTMAPEVAAGGATTIASEVYSLGATAYALLAGRYAHDDPDPYACMALVASHSPPRLRDVAPHVPQALSERVEHAMARAPADRFQRPDEFDTALGRLPAVTRRWVRTDEHGGHLMCFRGRAAGKSDATVCAVPVGAKAEVVAMHQPTGRRINAACRAAATIRNLPRNLRTAMAAVS